MDLDPQLLDSGARTAVKLAGKPPAELETAVSTSRCNKQRGEPFGWSLPVQRLAWPSVELDGDLVQVVLGVAVQRGAFGEVLPEQPVDASMSSGEFVPDDLVLPGGLVGDHRPVDDVDQVALQDPARAAGAFAGLVAGGPVVAGPGVWGAFPR
jgi:hypothetical protein